MKSKALCILKIAIAGEFGASQILCPAFAGFEKFCRIAFASEIFIYKYTLKVADRGGFCTLHVVMAQTALCKAYGNIAAIFDEASGILAINCVDKGLLKFIYGVATPHFNC